MRFSVLFDFFKYSVLFMPFSFASSRPSAVTTYIASHRVWSPISGWLVCLFVSDGHHPQALSMKKRSGRLCFIWILQLSQE